LLPKRLAIVGRAFGEGATTLFLVRAEHRAFAPKDFSAAQDAVPFFLQGGKKTWPHRWLDGAPVLFFFFRWSSRHMSFAQLAPLPFFLPRSALTWMDLLLFSPFLLGISEKHPWDFFPPPSLLGALLLKEESPKSPPGHGSSKFSPHHFFPPPPSCYLQSRSPPSSFPPQIF